MPKKPINKNKGKIEKPANKKPSKGSKRSARKVKREDAIFSFCYVLLEMLKSRRTGKKQLFENEQIEALKRLERDGPPEMRKWFKEAKEMVVNGKATEFMREYNRRKEEEKKKK